MRKLSAEHRLGIEYTVLAKVIELKLEERQCRNEYRDTSKAFNRIMRMQCVTYMSTNLTTK